MSEVYNNNNNNVGSIISGGFFEFDDGGCYAGDWVNGQAYGYGKCTGPQGKGEYAGTWKSGFEVSGVYTWPNGNTYAGEWAEGKRGGIGVETKRNWVYKGEWTQGLKGKHGVRLNLTSEAKYEGSWQAGMQEGLGVETYVDESTYQGQWSKGLRHGFGVRKSVPRGIAAIYHSSGSATCLRTSASLPSGLSNKHTSSVSSQDGIYGSTLDNRKHDDSDRDRGGFVLVEKTKPTLPTHHSLHRSRSFSLSRTLSKKLKVKHSESLNGASKLNQANSNVFSSDPSNLCGSADTGRTSLLACSVDVNLASVIEIYAGEWKNDKRCGFGMSQRSDGLRYEGEWFNDRRCGYGVTVFKDGTREEGKYRNNELISSLSHKRKIFSKGKFKDRIDVSVGFARKAAETANQKSELALAKRRNASSKATLAEEAARRAYYFADVARKHAQKFEISLNSTEPTLLEYGISGSRTMEENVKKQIGRGESADSQMSSWSSSSQQSAKKNPIERPFQDDDNVFMNPHEKYPSIVSNEVPKTLESMGSKIANLDQHIKNKLNQVGRHPSTENPPKSKIPLRPTTRQNDKRDYFSDSTPEIILTNGDISPFSNLPNTSGRNAEISSFPDTEKYKNCQIKKTSPVATSSKTTEGVNQTAGNFDIQTDLQNYLSNRQTSIVQEENQKRPSLEDLRRRLLSKEGNQSLEPQKSSADSKVSLGSKVEKNCSTLPHSNVSPGTQEAVDNSEAPVPDDSRQESPTNHMSSLSERIGEEIIKPNTEPSIRLQSWLQQNLLTIVFVIINFCLSAIFFGLWSARD